MAILLPPPNVILPNYDRALVGQFPSLEAGAYGARVNDASSNWYNPAGLILAKNTSINASSSAYRWTGVKTEAAGFETGSTTGAQPPSFFGVVIGEPIIGSDRVRVGFSVVNETYWAPTLQTQILFAPTAGPNQRLLYSTRDNFTETVPAFAIAFSPADHVRLGFALGADVVNYQTNDSLSNQATDASSHTVFIRGAQVNSSAVNLLGTVGAQFDASEHVKLSMVLKSPSVSLWGSGKLTIENTGSGSGTLTDSAIYDEDASFSYKRPWTASLGIAYVARVFEIEAEARYHSALGPFTVFSSTQPIVTTTSSGGAPATTTSSFDEVRNEFRNIVNLAFGTKYSLSEAVDLHAGFFTSASPLSAGDNAIFRKVDLEGITFGVGFTAERFSASLGVAYEFGTSEPYPVPSSLTGQTVSTTVDVTAVSVLYGISFSF